MEEVDEDSGSIDLIGSPRLQSVGGMCCPSPGDNTSTSANGKANPDTNTITVANAFTKSKLAVSVYLLINESKCCRIGEAGKAS